jgi:excisionase family DNA binding protein
MRMGRGTDKLLDEILAKVETMVMTQDEYLSLRQLAEYSKLSVRSLRRFIAEDDLPHYRVKGAGGSTGKVLVRRSDFDRWMETQWRHDGRDIDDIVNRTMESLRGIR